MSLASTSSRSSTQSSLHTPTSRPMSIASTSSPRNSFSGSATTNPYSSCAYPSWRSGSALRKNGTPSSYVSDEDLFGDDDEPYLSEPPPPPRPAEVWMAKPLLPPVYPIKSRKSSSSSSSHSHKKKRSSSSEKPKE